METDSIGINICILCKNTCNEKQENISEKDWLNLKTISLEWKHLDKYYDVYDTVNWDWVQMDNFGTVIVSVKFVARENQIKLKLEKENSMN